MKKGEHFWCSMYGKTHGGIYIGAYNYFKDGELMCHVQMATNECAMPISKMFKFEKDVTIEPDNFRPYAGPKPDTTPLKLGQYWVVKPDSFIPELHENSSSARS